MPPGTSPRRAAVCASPLLPRPAFPVLAALVAVWLAQACGGGERLPQVPDDGDPGQPAGTFTAADGTRFSVEIVAAGLEVPWSLAFAPDGRIFVAERPGRVRIVSGGQVEPRPALTLTDVYAQGEAGLLGLTLHPQFESNRLVFLVYTARRSDGTPVNRVVRFRELNGELGEPVVLLDDIDAASIHDGARIKFGPDGLLYVTMGDAADASLAQDLASLNGKVLRLNEDGTTPRDNPYSSPVYSWGHRNPQGIDWDPQTGSLWETEHGQSALDEVNRVEAGKNYGWPEIQGAETRPGMEPPALFFEQTVAPSGAAFYRGGRIPSFAGNLFFATLRGTHLHRVVLQSPNRTAVSSHERLLDGVFGRLRDVAMGNDGALYFSTSNRDGRGTPAPEDDRILRIVPASSPERSTREP